MVHRSTYKFFNDRVEEFEKAGERIEQEELNKKKVDAVIFHKEMPVLIGMKLKNVKKQNVLEYTLYLFPAKLSFD